MSDLLGIKALRQRVAELDGPLALFLWSRQYGTGKREAKVYQKHIHVHACKCGLQPKGKR